MKLTMTDHKDLFRSLGAVYEMPALPSEPGPQGEIPPHIDFLKSDRHGPDFFLSDRVVQHPGIVRKIAREWADILEARGLVPKKVLCHAPFASIPGFALALELSERGHDTLFAYSRLTPGGSIKYRTDFDIEEGDTFVVVADDVVSGDSTIDTALDAMQRGGIPLPAVPCFANLSGSDSLSLGAGSGYEELPFLAASTFSREIIPTRERPCDFCAVGSVALAPRAPGNWQVLQSWMPPSPTS